MKMVVVFEIPNDQVEAYADTASRMITSHAFATQQQTKHWSFDVEMRPIAAALVPATVQDDMVEAADFIAELLAG
jgi:hypothetical protein